MSGENSRETQTYGALVEHAPMCIHEIDLEGCVTAMNPAGLAMLDVPLETVLGAHFLSFAQEQDRARLAGCLAEALAGTRTEFEFAPAINDGKVRLQSALVPLRDDDGGVVGLMGITQDVTERRAVERRLRKSEARFRDFADTAADMFWETDAEQRIVSLDGYLTGPAGRTREQIAGRTVRSFMTLVHAMEPGASRTPEAMDRHETFRSIEVRWLSPDGRLGSFAISGKPLFATDGSLVGYRGTARNTSDMQALGQRLSYEATHDGLTGAFNRAAFEERLEDLLANAVSGDREHVLCYIDLDQFKVINDACGHVAGDELLRQLAEIVAGIVRGDEMLARLGGDEFAVLLEDCSLEDAEQRVGLLIEAVDRHRFTWGDEVFAIGVSVAIVTIGGELRSVSGVLGAADSLCYIAKDQGGGRSLSYHPENAELLARRDEMQWVARITTAQQENRFCLYAQPIVAVQAGVQSALHFEVLLRMREPAGGIVAPGTFLPAAERYGLSTRIDLWVLEQTLIELSTVGSAMSPIDLCCINLSGQSLGEEGFLENVLKLFGAHEVDPGLICFEVTETSAISHLQHAVQFMRAMRDTGASFALDDFGTGLSSFAYLKNLPADFVKIDGSFVLDLTGDPLNRIIVKSITDVAKQMGMKVVAEWVENQCVLDELEQLGVDFAQGYHLGRPVPIAELLP